ncbi:MAG: hypothetical protein ACI841_002082 [Planctomycetota bacterium]|jgi:hypothetical protein
MDLTDFRQSLTSDSPPDGLGDGTRAMWHAAKGAWDRAHEIAQDAGNEAGDWVHGYLHRVEGDLPNARYWYGRVEREIPDASVEEEWEQITLELLSREAAAD